MKRGRMFVKIVLLVALFSVLAMPENPLAEEQTMPQMGAPQEIKAMNWLIGTWDAAMKWRMAPTDTNWTPMPGVATYMYSLDSCVIVSDFDGGTFMGMQFKGWYVQTFDRNTGKWQSVWVDNMAGRMSYMEGTKVGDSTIFTGTDPQPDGSLMHMRILTFNETPTSFEWRMDGSTDGGKSYYVAGMATYTKRSK